MKLLVINPGSTSTKVALYEETRQVFSDTIRHGDVEFQGLRYVADQVPMRFQRIAKWMDEHRVCFTDLTAVVGRGGLLNAVSGGTYIVNKRMVDDVIEAINGEHASNLGVMLAFQIGKTYNIPAFTVDPVSTDEFDDVSRITGLSDIKKASWLHALNIKACCRKVAFNRGLDFEQSNFIVSHLGSGLSHAIVSKGRIIDGSGGRSDGPFSPERSGGLPTYALVNLCYSGIYTHEQMIDKISNCGGMYDYLGTKNLELIEEKALKGVSPYKEILDAFCYKVAKEIASYSAVVCGKVDVIIITGGISHSQYVIRSVTERVAWLAPIEVIPGEMEMEALALGAYRVLSGTETAKEYV